MAQQLTHLSNYSLSVKNWESDVSKNLNNQRSGREATSDLHLFRSYTQKGLSSSLSPPYYFLSPICPQSSKTSMVHFGQLVASSDFKQALLSEYDQNITQQAVPI